MVNVDHYNMNLGPFKILYYEWKVNGGDEIPFIKTHLKWWCMNFIHEKLNHMKFHMNYIYIYIYIIIKS
jgi:hypothetical protein